MSLTDQDKEWISSQLQRLETKLSTRFAKCAGPTDDPRLHTRAAVLRVLDLEMKARDARGQGFDHLP